MYLLPGLIDAHVHISNFAAAERALLSGVPTARSADGAFFQDVGLRELARSGTIRSPELLAAGWHIRPEPGDAFFIDRPEMADLRANGLRGPDAMRRVARVIAERKVDWVKVTATGPRRPADHGPAQHAVLAGGTAGAGRGGGRARATGSGARARR